MAIRNQLQKLIRSNKTLVDFAERFEELIKSYNAGSLVEFVEDALNRPLGQRHD